MPSRGVVVCMTQPIRQHVDTKAVQADAKIISEALENGRLSRVIDLHFQMPEHRDVIRYMESNQQVGKIVLNP